MFVGGALGSRTVAVAAQIDAVFDDFEVSAVKTGMLGSAAIVETVAAMLKPQNVANLVVDPVDLSPIFEHIFGHQPRASDFRPVKRLGLGPTIPPQREKYEIVQEWSNLLQGRP